MVSHVLCIILLGFIGYYFSAASVLKKEFFASMFFDANFCNKRFGWIIRENYAVNERPAIVFADKTEEKQKNKGKSNRSARRH
jgi:hypothetical protein